METALRETPKAGSFALAAMFRQEIFPTASPLRHKAPTENGHLLAEMPADRLLAVYNFENQ